MKTLRVLEITAWAAGALMLVIYTGVRSWYADARDEGLASFEAARGSSHRGAESPAGESMRLTDPVDTSLWSPHRLETYKRSLEEKPVPAAVLRIPSARLIVPVFEGTSEWSLNRGAGRIEGTANIGEPGNIGIAAHRDGFFRSLKDIRPGDLVVLDRFAATDTYRVSATYIVHPGEISVLEPTATRSITLVTCYPFYFVGSAPLRFIVRAQLLAPVESAPAGGHSE